jgi:putative sigma-54 modulation protein
MNIVVNGKNIELTEALVNYAKEKFDKLNQYFDHILEIDVTLSVDKVRDKDKRQACDVTIWANGNVMRASEASEDLYASIDLVLNKLERQVKKYKEKLKDRPKRESAKYAEATHKIINVPFEEHEAGHQTEIQKPKIVRSKTFSMKPMFIEDAALQLQMLNQDFVVFSNAETNQVNVVYKRNDGHIGLIEPHA